MPRTDNEISAKYVCFKINEIEYCLKGNDSNLFAINTNIIKEVYEKFTWQSYDFLSIFVGIITNNLILKEHG